MKATQPMQANDPKLSAYLAHAVTDYDRRQQTRRGYNPYAIGHYLGAVQAIEADITQGADVRAAVLDHLTGPLASFVLRTIGHAALTRDEARR